MMDMPTVAIPLRTDEDGVIRIGDTRITLETIVACHKRQDTPEQIHEGFSTLALADIYAVVAYYLANTQEVDAYIQHVEEEGEQLRKVWEAEHPPTLTKATLLARQ
jgi:uncharacterized protein (DUF433 family)